MSDIYLSLTETPSVVTLSQPVIASSVAATVTVGNTVTVALDANSLSALENVTVTVGAAISGTVTVANFPASQTVQGTVTVGSLPAISGSVTVNNFPASQTIAGTVTVGNFDFSATGQGGQFATKSVQVGFISDSNSDFYVAAGEDYPFPVNIRNSVTVGSLPAISGTVTANNPSGALTTRFGSVTTANTAQITSAVTNTSRKYLLAQNISAGTVTIGIGFSPTTTQGIQLTAGAGLTFDSFCPTGAVFWLGAVTGAAFTILEG